jgi:hypothetical protein
MINSRTHDLSIEEKDYYYLMKEVYSLFGEPHPKASIHPSTNNIIAMTDSIQKSSSLLIEMIPNNDYICYISYHWPRLGIDVEIYKN